MISEVKANIKNEDEERIKKYLSYKIPQFEVDFLRELENQTGKQFSMINKFKWNNRMKFSVEKQLITGLVFYYCNLSSLPESIGNLTSLKYLNLCRNQLKKLPESTGKLTSLQELCLRDNKLTFLPRSIGNLLSLETLGLEYNQLTEIPESIINLKSLKQIDMYHNPLISESKSTNNNLLKLLRKNNILVNDNVYSKIKKKFNNNLINILLVGDGGVGRSVMAERYITGNFNPEMKMTILVEFYSKKVEYEGISYNLRLIDLSGQQRWRFLQFDFIKNADGAIFTFDLLRFDTFLKAKEWMKFCRSYNFNLPILCVGAKKDVDHLNPIDNDTIMTYIEELKFLDFIKISSYTGENVDEAIALLLKHILNSSES